MSSLRFSLQPFSWTLSVHLAHFALDETLQSLVIRGVVRFDKSVVISILCREVPQGLTLVSWDVIQSRATFTARCSEVTRYRSLRPEGGLGLAEVGL